MMSAKTVSTDVQATPATPASPNNTTAPAGSSEFQNLLSGAAPTVNLTIVENAGQPLVQVLTGKLPQAARTAAAAAQAAATAGVAAPLEDCAAAGMIKLLTDSATLLPDTGEAEAAAPVAAPPPEVDAEDHVESPDDLVAGWLEAYLPSNLFVQQAGAKQSAESGVGADISPGKDASPAQITASLLRQAGLADTNTGVAAAAASAAQAITGGIGVDMAASTATQNPVTALAAALITTTDGADRDKPTNENWMAALGDASAKRAPDAAPVAARISTPVHDNRWADAIAHRLVMMARDGESTASLKLVPVDLGPLDIQISVKDGEANVHFGAAHPETRQVLEASLPRLREMLSAQGLQLNNASVSHQSAGKGSPERPVVRGIDGIAEETETVSVSVVSTSLLDTYA
jgi:flagellar hook-length control protein FliK